MRICFVQVNDVMSNNLDNLKENSETLTFYDNPFDLCAKADKASEEACRGIKHKHSNVTSVFSLLMKGEKHVCPGARACENSLE